MVRALKRTQAAPGGWSEREGPGDEPVTRLWGRKVKAFKSREWTEEMYLRDF